MWMVRALTFVLVSGALLGQDNARPTEAAASVLPPGDAARGNALFEGKGACLGCHRVGDKGSRFGPDLTDIGARAGNTSLMRGGRGRGGPGGRGAPPSGAAASSGAAGRAQAELERALVDPGAEILPQNRTVRLVTRTGESITARVLNQDTFSLQLIDTRERVMSIQKSDLREFTFLQNSPMPSYRDKLSQQELADVVAYLLSLKGINK
jgi:mono/diheme cytochrome c family protein